MESNIISNLTGKDICKVTNIYLDKHDPLKCAKKYLGRINFKSY